MDNDGVLARGPIIKSCDGEPADLGDQAVRLALLQVEAHFRSKHPNIITWLKNGHMLPMRQKYSLQVVKQVLHGIAWYCIHSANASVEIFYHLSFSRADFT